MAKVITVPEHIKLKQCHCDKGKHRFRENKFGVTWCVICGQLSTNNMGKVEPLEEDDKFIIRVETSMSRRIFLKIKIFFKRLWHGFCIVYKKID